MATIGRWTVGTLAAVTFSLLQSLLRWTIGAEWAVWVYEMVAFVAFCWLLDRLIFAPSRRAAAAAAQPGPRGVGEG